MVSKELYNQMITELQVELGFDFENPSYKKLNADLSNKVRAIYKRYANTIQLDPKKPIYSSNGILIANSFDRIVIGDYGAYIEFTKEQSNHKNFIVAPGQEYRLTPKYNKTIKYEWYTTKKNDCKLYWQLRGVVYADYKPLRYYISPFEVKQDNNKGEITMANKIYAVKQGYKPGIYNTWAECEAQVKGYKGAEYKSFNNEEEAKLYVYGEVKNTSHSSLNGEQSEIIKWELYGIREGLKERDIPFILSKVNTIAEVLGIELDKEDISEYRKK